MKFVKNVFLFLCLTTLGTSTLLAQQPMVNSVTIAGVKRIKEQYVQKIIKIRSNTQLDSSMIHEDILRLKRLTSVSHAYFSVDSAHNVKYTIEENFTLIPYLNIYTSSQKNIATRVGLSEYNLLGRNISAGGFYQRDVFNSFGVNVQAPHLFGRHFGLAVSAQTLSTLEPIFSENETRSDYKYTNRNVEVAGLFELSFKNKLLLGYSIFNEIYEYSTGAIDLSIPQYLDVDKSLFKVNYQYNNINYHYQYLSGLKTEVNVQFVNADGVMFDNFKIGRVDLSYFKRIREKSNFASRLRIGLSTNSPSPFAPFSIDNNLNVRGVGNVIDRGTAAAVYNAELRHTLFDGKWITVQGNVFIDGGTWRNPGGLLNELLSKENFRLHSGVGVRLINKNVVNAVLRIDYGAGVLKYDRSRGFVIGIGQYF